MTPQTIRLLTILTFVVGGFAVARPMFVPDTYGDMGNYRAAAIEEIAAREPHYAGRAACIECHEEAEDAVAGGEHSTLGCETCHRAASAHVADPDHIAMVVPVEEQSRQMCGSCHAARTGRPANMTVIDVTDHEDEDPCVFCHAPHEAE